MSERNVRLLIEDILLSSGKIIAYTHGLSLSDFITDEKTIDAVIRNFEIIGEAANRLPEQLKEQFHEIDWHRIRGFRNRIVHDYMGINLEIVWDIKENFLPNLITEIESILPGLP